MGLFEGLGQAKMNRPANYLKAGEYILRCDKCKAGANRQKVPFFACETTVVHRMSENDASRHRVGEEASALVCTTSDYFLGDVKQIIYAFSGVSEDQITEDMADQVCAEDQPLAGMLCHYQGLSQESKEGKVYTKRVFRPITFKEASDLLTDAEKERFFPGVDWEALIQGEQE